MAVALMTNSETLDSAHSSAVAARPTSSALKGKATERVSTDLHVEVALDLERAWRDAGYGSRADCIREVLMIWMYSKEHVQSLHTDRIESTARNLTGIGPRFG